MEANDNSADFLHALKTLFGTDDMTQWLKVEPDAFMEMILLDLRGALNSIVDWATAIHEADGAESMALTSRIGQRAVQLAEAAEFILGASDSVKLLLNAMAGYTRLLRENHQSGW